MWKAKVVWHPCALRRCEDAHAIGIDPLARRKGRIELPSARNVVFSNMLATLR